MRAGTRTEPTMDHYKKERSSRQHLRIDLESSLSQVKTTKVVEFCRKELLMTCNEYESVIHVVL